jgi:hypothetical protein
VEFSENAVYNEIQESKIANPDKFSQLHVPETSGFGKIGILRRWAKDVLQYGTSNKGREGHLCNLF